MKPNRRRGSVLVITLSVITIAVAMLASYLVLVQSEVANISRSQTWNRSIAIAEAGMEEGYAMINFNQPNGLGNAYDFTNHLAECGWVISGATATKSNNIGSNYYLAKIEFDPAGVVAPKVTAAGVVSYTAIPYIFSAARSHSFLAQVGSGTGNGVSAPVVFGRSIQSQTVLNPLFTAAIVCKSNFNMNGQNCTVDSYDSSPSSPYNTLGYYDLTKRQANGNVATDSAIVDTMNIGNGNVYGYVYTGPGSVESCVAIKNNGLVGDLTWTSGIQPGHWAGNFNMTIPDVAVPNITGWVSSLPKATNGAIPLNGNYYTSTAPSSPLQVNGPTMLWLQGGGPKNGLDVNIATNASLVMYVGNTKGSAVSLTLSGNGNMNTPGIPRNFQIYGLPTLTSVAFSGNAGWTGTLYAPEAAFTGNGGGNNVQDCSGAIVVGSCTLNGHWNFHYDQSLTNSGPSRGWLATGWKEIPFTTSQN